MLPDPTNLIEMSGIKTPLIGFYDVPDPEPFAPFAEPKQCYFFSYQDWMNGNSIWISTDESKCRGGGYWIGGLEFTTREEFAKTLNQREGFKSSDELMYQWMLNLKPYQIENGYIVLGPLKNDQYEHLKTVTFYVNPDQLSLLLIGAEYSNASINGNPVMAAFGSGCGQIIAQFDDVNSNSPKAVIGATDIAMRQHLPPDILAFTVNRPMFKQLCELDEESFLYKPFWQRLRKARGEI